MLPASLDTETPSYVGQWILHFLVYNMPLNISPVILQFWEKNLTLLKVNNSFGAMC